MKTFKNFLVENSEKKNIAEIYIDDNEIIFYSSNDFCRELRLRLPNNKIDNIYYDDKDIRLQIINIKKKYGLKIAELQNAYADILESLTRLSIAELQSLVE